MFRILKIFSKLFPNTYVIDPNNSFPETQTPEKVVNSKCFDNKIYSDRIIKQYNNAKFMHMV